MEKFNNKYRIPSARLQTWDYGANGAYFITICTQNRIHFLGEIVDAPNVGVSTMQLNALGKLAEKYWLEIPHHFPFVELGEFVVMPNHVHGILIINTMGGDTVEMQNVNTQNVEMGNVDTAMVEMQNVEPGMVEMQNVDTGMVEMQNVDTGMVDTGMVETQNVETAMVETAMVETGIVEPGIVEPANVEMQNVNTGMVDTGMVEMQNVNTGMVEPGIVEPGIVEPGMVEMQNVEAGMVETGMVEMGIVEPGIVESGIVEPANVEPANVEMQNVNTGNVNTQNVETRLIASLPNQTETNGGFAGNKNPMIHENISRIIRWYKGRCSYELRKIHADFGWQSRFHDHIIRDEQSYQNITHYIINNPAKWAKDTFYG